MYFLVESRRMVKDGRGSSQSRPEVLYLNSSRIWRVASLAAIEYSARWYRVGNVRPGWLFSQPGLFFVYGRIALL